MIVFRGSIAAVAALLLTGPAAVAGQVSNPLDLPAGFAAGHLLLSPAAPSQGAVDGGAPGTMATVNSPVPVANGGTGATGATGARANLGAAASGANGDITSLGGLTSALPVAEGGTGAATAAGARANLTAAQSGSNGDITSLGGLTTPLSKAQGGTGGATGQAAANGLSLVYVLPPITNDVTVTGTTSEVIAAYINVPANAVGANGSIKLDGVLDATGATLANYVTRVRVAAGSNGTTSGSALVSATSAKSDTMRFNVMIRNKGATNAQDAFSNITSSYSQTSNTIQTSAVDTTSAWTISFNIVPGNSADTIVLKHLEATLVTTAGN
ncbi:MAG TPA: hypothetical protein VN632_10475 [Stellaceae bacterium]|nr:hypothetical protein [Stellaceae bacterium]